MTKTKTILAVMVLTLAPTAGLAKCFAGDEVVAQFCAVGQSWDAAAQVCAPSVG